MSVCASLQNIPHLLVECAWTAFPGVDLCLSNFATQQDRWDFRSETFIRPSSELKRFQIVQVLRHKSASFNFRHAGSDCCRLPLQKTHSARRRDCKLVNNRCRYEGLAQTLQLQHVFSELDDIHAAFLFTRFGSSLRCASARHGLTPIGSLPLSPAGSVDRKASHLVNVTDRRFVRAPTSSGQSCGMTALPRITLSIPTCTNQ